MGGRGSGRQATHGGKDVAEESTPLDIRKLARAGLLVPGNSFGWKWTVCDRETSAITIRVSEQAVQLCYQKRGTGEVIDQWVHLQSTACRFGGVRQWFTCPSCSKRVAVLYGVRQILCLPKLLRSGVRQPEGGCG